VHLIDTPGFNDNRQSDGEVLQELAYWLAAAYERGIKLSGLVYLHCIMDNRFPGSAVRALDIFKKMCGEEAFCGVIFATTKWDLVAVDDLAQAVNRHEEFRQKVRHDVVKQGGGKVVSLSVAETDVKNILRHVVGNNRRLTLAFQRQLVDENRHMYETDAGRLLFNHLNERFQSLKSMVDAARRGMDDSVSMGRKETLRELSNTASEMRLVDDDIERTKAALGEIRDSWENIINREDQRLALAAQQRLQRLELERRRYETNESTASVSADTSTPALSDISNISSIGCCPSCASQESIALRLQELDKERQALTIRAGQRLSKRYTTSVRTPTTLGAIGTTLAAGQLIAALACVVM